MKIKDVSFSSDVLDKLIWKHNVQEFEVRQVFNNIPMFRFIEKGRVKGEHLYLVLGQADSGRYLAVFFILKKDKRALIVSARDMTERERRRYVKR